jgi:hypothetical protein
MSLQSSSRNSVNFEYAETEPQQQSRDDVSDETGQTPSPSHLPSYYNQAFAANPIPPSHDDDSHRALGYTLKPGVRSRLGWSEPGLQNISRIISESAVRSVGRPLLRTNAKWVFQPRKTRYAHQRYNDTLSATQARDQPTISERLDKLRLITGFPSKSKECTPRHLLSQADLDYLQELPHNPLGSDRQNNTARSGSTPSDFNGVSPPTSTTGSRLSARPDSLAPSISLLDQALQANFLHPCMAQSLVAEGMMKQTQLELLELEKKQIGIQLRMCEHKRTALQFSSGDGLDSSTSQWRYLPNHKRLC